MFLTRAEFFFAIAGASSLAILMTLQSPISWRRYWSAWILFAVIMNVPFIAAVGLLSLAMPMKLAIHGTFGMWPAMLNGAVGRQQF